MICNLFMSGVAAQDSTVLILQNQKNSELKRYNSTDMLKVIFMSAGTEVKSKGILKILNDSTIEINGILIKIDSIFSIGKISRKKRIIGHTSALGGGVIAGMGIYYVSLSQNSSSFFNSLFGYFYRAVGTALIVGSVPVIAAGEYIAHGSMMDVKKHNRKLIVK